MKVLRGWKQQLYFQIKHIYAAFILSQRQKQNKFLMGIKAGFTIFWLFSTVNNGTEIDYNTGSNLQVVKSDSKTGFMLQVKASQEYEFM